MGVVTTQRYVRKPLFVDAVRVRENNFEDIAKWCDGEITKEVRGSGAPKPCIRVRVQYPKNLRQTLAFDGDWILYTDRGYKVYTNKAFKLAFDPTDDQSAPPTERPPDPAPNERTAEPERAATAEEIRAGLPNAQDRRRPVEEPQATGEGVKQIVDPAVDPDQPEDDGGVPQPMPDVVERPPVETAVDEHHTPQGEPHVYEEGIADAMRGNEAARERVATEAAREGVEVKDSPSSPPVQPPEVAPEPIRAEPVSEQPPAIAAAGKQVLSEDEQRRMGHDRVQALVRSGDAVLAQDLA